MTITFGMDSFDTNWIERENVSNVVEFVENNKKNIKIGDIVYYIKCGEFCIPTIEYGVVEDLLEDKDGVCGYAVSTLAPYVVTKINGVDVNTMQFPTRWQKLPEEVLYDNENALYDGVNNLFEIDYEESIKPDITNPLAIKEALEKGTVKRCSKTNSLTYKPQITRFGWRIVEEYSNRETCAINDCCKAFTLKDVYKTYEEVKADVDHHMKLLREQAEMSEHDWNVRRVENEIDMMLMFTTPNTKDDVLKYIEKCKKELLEKDIKNLIIVAEPRGIRWRMVDRKRWSYIEGLE